MEAKHKNALIGALLAVVFVMAVGYAAFAQQLTINGSAEITSKWDVHMEDGSYEPTSTMGTNPTGSLTVEEGGLTATFSVNLTSPGDYMTFTIPVVNKGTIDAKLSGITLSSDTPEMALDQEQLTATTKDGNIKYTVTSPGNGTLANTSGTANVIVKAEFVNKPEGNTNAQNVTGNLTITMNYIQA